MEPSVNIEEVFMNMPDCMKQRFIVDMVKANPIWWSMTLYRIDQQEAGSYERRESEMFYGLPLSTRETQ